MTFRLWTGGDPVSSWVEQIQAGIDSEANFERLFRHFRPRVTRFFSKRGLEPALCEELTQDTFFRAFDRIRSFERRSQFSTWLFEIAKNAFNNELRSRQAAKRDGYELPLQEERDPDEDDRAKVASPLISKAPSPYDEVERREQRLALRKALDTLPPQMRRCIFLRLDQDLKYREIAETLRISIDTVKAHLGQAKVRLQWMLADPDGELARLDEEPETRLQTAGRSGNETET
jgi:RNA polymerase sigma-70 factor (ECF subfamily)